ncbi:MAG: hypothetical protein ACREI7_08265 [Myxococcota bacterium]
MKRLTIVTSKGNTPIEGVAAVLHPQKPRDDAIAMTEPVYLCVL